MSAAPVRTLARAVVLRGVILIGAIAAALPPVAHAQQAPTTATLRATFQKFDITQDGWLDGREVDACGCMAFDRNGDREITWEEYRAGSGTGAAPAASARITTPVRSPPPAASVATAYRIPDRVEVDYDGTWYPGSIYAVRDGQYKVMRDGYTSDSRWVTLSALRRLAPTPRQPPDGRSALPRSVPLGTYLCSSFTSSASRSILGQLRVTGSGQYTALTREGTGAAARFTYDPATGSITWGGGKLQGFFGTVESTTFGYDTQRTPVITASYVVRAGGNSFDLSCARQ